MLREMICKLLLCSHLGKISGDEYFIINYTRTIHHHQARLRAHLVLDIIWRRRRPRREREMLIWILVSALVARKRWAADGARLISALFLLQTRLFEFYVRCCVYVLSGGAAGQRSRKRET